MNRTMNVYKAGLVLGAVMGGWHACWATLVALRLAQPIIDFVFWVHFIKPVYVIEPFEITRAAILLIVTAALGFAIGAVFSMIWNAVHKA